jgi:hypothetical protein
MCVIRTPDHLIEAVTPKRFGREQNLDPRTIRKQTKRAIDSLWEANKDLPYWLTRDCQVSRAATDQTPYTHR